MTALLLASLAGLTACPEENPDAVDLRPRRIPADLSIRPVVTMLSGFKQPESAYFEPLEKVWYVSNIDGIPGMKDGGGSITRISADLKTVEHNWVMGMNSPAGLSSYDISPDNVDLVVVDVDELISIQTSTKAFYRRTVAVMPGGYLNDVGLAGDDTFLTETLANRLWRLTPFVSENEIYLTGPMLKNPNGLFVDGIDLYMVSTGDLMNPADRGDLWKGNTVDRSTMMKFGNVVGKMDGVVKDGSSLLVSDFVTRVVRRVDLATGKMTSVVHDFSEPPEK